jgi:hypothetical protein
MNRRTFSKSALLLAVLPTFSLVGCWFDTVEADIAAYVPFLLQAVSGVVALFDPALAATLQTVITLVNAGLAALTKAIADWKAADAAQKPGFVGAIIAALETATSDLGTFLAAIKVNAPPAIYSAALALITIIQGVLVFFQNKLTGANPVSLKMVAGTQIEPLNLSSKQFKAAFNAKCVSIGHPESQIR